MIKPINITIKKMSELSSTDMYKILKKREEVFIVEQNCPYPDCDGKDFDSYHMICDIDGEIVAYLRILPKGLSYSEVSLGRVLVDKSHRGHGYGLQMVKSAVEFIENILCENEIRISAQLYLVNFYSSLGFSRVGDPYEEDWLPHTEMFYKSL